MDLTVITSPSAQSHCWQGGKRWLQVHVAPQLGIETLIIFIPRSRGNGCVNLKQKLQRKDGLLQANKHYPAIY